jgi:hypothetical protein
MANIITPAMLQTFEKSFHVAAQQKQTLLSASGVVKYLPVEGKTNNYAGIKGFDLEEVTGQNPDKKYGEYETENRQMTKRRFTKTIYIDDKDDVNDLIADPTSYLVQNLVYAKNRVIDRIIASAAAGDVLVGAPNAAPTSKSAADDGVLTVDATAGLDYTDIQKITENFINNDLPIEEIRGSLLALSGKENSALMADEKFINNDYMNGATVNAGIVSKAGIYQTALFAGSVDGGITVANPILAEDSGSKARTCLVLAPQSILLSMNVNSLRVEPSYTKVGSKEVTIDLWINAMRSEGKRVQLIKTTM